MASHDEVSLDHIQPTSRGGAPGLENCHIVHKECNSIKGDFTLDEIWTLLDATKKFKGARALLVTRLKRSNMMFKNY